MNTARYPTYALMASFLLGCGGTPDQLEGDSGLEGTLDEDVSEISADTQLAHTWQLSTGELGGCSGRLYAYQNGATYYVVFQTPGVSLSAGQKAIVNTRLETTNSINNNVMLGYYMDAILDDGVPQGEPPSAVVSGENHTGYNAPYAVRGQMPLAGHWLFQAPRAGSYRFRLWARSATTATCQVAPTAACVRHGCGPAYLAVVEGREKSFIKVGTIHANAVETRSHTRWTNGAGSVTSGNPVTYLNEQRLRIPAGMTRAEITALMGVTNMTSLETVNLKMRARRVGARSWTYLPDSTGKTYRIDRNAHHKKTGLHGVLTGLRAGDEVEVQVIATLLSGSRVVLDTGYFDPTARSWLYGTYRVAPQTALIMAPKP
jgi:hypothetical protein